MKNLDYWLKWEYDCEFGLPVLLGAACEMYAMENGTQAYLSALETAAEEQRRQYEPAIYETLHMIAEHDDKETLASLFAICPWLTHCVANADVMTPLETAVEHSALGAIDAFLEAGMYSADEAMEAAILAEAEEAVLHLLNRDIQTETHLTKAISAAKPIRDAVFEQLKKQKKQVSDGYALRAALLENAETGFLRELADLCTPEVFSYCFEDGRRLPDYAETEDARNILLEKGAKPGDPTLIRLLSMNAEIYHVLADPEKKAQLLSVLQTPEQAPQALYDMCHRNGQYDKGDDLCHSILKRGDFELFERILEVLPGCACIDGSIYCAPFGMWVKWTAEDWKAYRRIVRALLDGGVPITENPILPMCRCVNYEYAATLQGDTEAVIEEVLELLTRHGVDIDQPFPDALCYHCLAAALYYGSTPIIRFLLKKGVKIISNRENPLVFLAFGVRSGGHEITEDLMVQLKAAGLDMNKTNQRGETVLHGICRRRNPSARMFARAAAWGADPTIADGSGKRPIDIAKEKGLDEICRFLEK